METATEVFRSSTLARRPLSWFLLARIAVITLFLGGTLVFQWGGSRNTENTGFLFLLIALSYFQAFVSAVLLPKVRHLLFYAQCQIVWDLLFVITLIYFTGGIGSNFSFLFILVIISSSIFLTRKEVLFVASAAAILYGSLLDLLYYRFIPPLKGLENSDFVSGSYVFYTVFINVTAFFLTAFLSGTVTERLRRSEQALQRREIDYEELDRLNRTILANINSGLMIVDVSGRIRSFNAGASKMTGYALEDVYNSKLEDFFPEFNIIAKDMFLLVNRVEACVSHRNGQRMILGYATSLVEDPQNKVSNLLVTFQDLTQFKNMEEQLKRSDRLAAVGRLASGMAHEIRNPLASISGSIQLLLESARFSAEDSKLMGIVVKEANRLSTLLTDFLLFARPKPPEYAMINASELLDEMVEMLASDLRFSTIAIEQEYPPGVGLWIDRQQIQQALWNLVINAAEAMPNGGSLFIGIADQAHIYIEDTGKGVPNEIKDRIFDPFFTTKDYGSGLGLSTVYAIVEGHGGRIEVVDGRHGGTRFRIYLPQQESRM